jgi:hypothetical protein
LPGANEIVDGGAHERYRLIAISTPSHLTRQVHIGDRQIAEVRSPLQDLGQKLYPAGTIRNRWAVHQCMAQRQPGEGQRNVITGSFGNP